MTDSQKRRLAAHTASLRAKARGDFEGFCRHCVQIKTKNGDVVPMVLNGPQKKVLAKIKELEDAGKPVRIVVLKSRQIGMSTFSQAWLAHKTILFGGRNGLTISQKEDMASELFGKIELLYDRMPTWAKPERDSRTRGKRLALKNLSLLYVESAENRDAGRSMHFQHVHATELPLWPDAKRTMDGLLQSVPKDAGTSVIVESTAAGMGDYFHWLWKGACEEGEGWNGFTPIFIPWYEMEEYADEPLPGEEILSPEEDELVAQYGLTLPQVVFYRRKLRELGEDKMKQEYPFTADEAFLASGRPFFTPSVIARYEKMIVRPDRKFAPRLGEYKCSFEDHKRGGLHIWEPPQAGVDYVIAADPSSGLADDFTGLHILKGLEQVGSYRAMISPEDLAVLMNRLGILYNTALLAPEYNNMGVVTVTDLVNKHQYPNVYHYTDETVIDGGGDSTRWGWYTSTVTRPLMLGNLARVTRLGELKLKCDRTLSEMKTFVINADPMKDKKFAEKAEAQYGEHDDLVTPLAIGVSVVLANPVVAAMPTVVKGLNR